MIDYPDPYRAQFFLDSLESRFTKLVEFFEGSCFFAGDIASSITPFAQGIARELDQIILPTLVHEIHQKKSQGLLRGENSVDRYRSFFVQEGSFSPYAKEILSRYPRLLQVLDCFVESSFDALRDCLERAVHDLARIEAIGKLESIELLGGADRHNNRQSLLLTFDSTQRLIYKPVDLRSDQVFDHFLTILDLEFPYDLQALRVMPARGYGWIYVLSRNECNTEMEVQHYFLRCGALLASAEALHYTDGHSENFFAAGEYPFLLDGETFFQNYSSLPPGSSKNILSTMMIQKADDEKGYFNSALQTPIEEKYEGFVTTPYFDHTDQICLRHVNSKPKLMHHYPIFCGSGVSAVDYLEQIIEGYTYTYNSISALKGLLLDDRPFWDAMGTVRSRVILRETAAYFYLLRNLQLPENMASNQQAVSYLSSKMEDSPYLEYEMTALMEMNIPYFFQQPNSCHIFDGNGGVYPNVFRSSAIEGLKTSLESRSPSQLTFNREILKNHLVHVERVYG